MIAVTIPMKIPSAANLREHHMAKARRVKAQRSAARLYLLDAENRGARRPALPVVVTLTRIAPRKLDAHDNVRHALKGVVDGIADWLKLRDDDARIEWRYAQEKGAPKQSALRIEVASANMEVA